MVKRHKPLTEARLADEDVYEMRVLALSGVSHRVIVKRYEVDQSTATRAIQWRHPSAGAAPDRKAASAAWTTPLPRVRGCG